MSNSLIVYTAVIGNYDKLAEPPESLKDVRFVCFTDDLSLYDKASRWEFRHVQRDEKLGQIKTAREIKIRPHKYFPEFQNSLWIDGNIRLNDAAATLINKILTSERDIFVINHPARQCIYAEGFECIRLQKDSPNTIIEWLKKIKSEGYPRNSGLAETNIIFRRHNEEKVKRAMELWWEILQSHSCRDQLSFNYAAKSTNLDLSYFEGSARGDNLAFSLLQHGTLRLEATITRTDLPWLRKFKKDIVELIRYWGI